MAGGVVAASDRFSYRTGLELLNQRLKKVECVLHHARGQVITARIQRQGKLWSPILFVQNRD